jgi:hypothetical protein
MHYDPMIAKLVVWGENRAAALVKLKDCLSKFQVYLIKGLLVKVSGILDFRVAEQCDRVYYGHCYNCCAFIHLFLSCNTREIIPFIGYLLGLGAIW